MNPSAPLATPKATLQLPGLVISPTDITRLSREVQALEDFLQQAAIRSPGSPVHMPRTSNLFEELAAINKFNWLSKEDREAAVSFLTFMKTKAPVVHISFAADPSAAFMAKLVGWLRRNIHPQILVRIGLQPTIAAGCVIRTSSHVYDFSLRRHLTDSESILVESLRKYAALP